MNLSGATLDEVAAQGLGVDEIRLMLAYRAARRYTKIPSSKRPDVVNDYLPDDSTTGWIVARVPDFLFQGSFTQV